MHVCTLPLGLGRSTLHFSDHHGQQRLVRPVVASRERPSRPSARARSGRAPSGAAVLGGGKPPRCQRVLDQADCAAEGRRPGREAAAGSGGDPDFAQDVRIQSPAVLSGLSPWFCMKRTVFKTRTALGQASTYNGPKRLLLPQTPP